jgi:hypothetical protein
MVCRLLARFTLSTYLSTYCLPTLSTYTRIRIWHLAWHLYGNCREYNTTHFKYSIHPSPHSPLCRAQTSLPAPFPHLSYPLLSQHPPIPCSSSLPCLAPPPQKTSPKSHKKPSLSTHCCTTHPSARHPNSDPPKDNNPKRDIGARNITSKPDTRFRKTVAVVTGTYRPRATDLAHPPPLSTLAQATRSCLGTGWDETRTGCVAEPVGFRWGGWSALFLFRLGFGGGGDRAEGGGVASEYT